MLPLPFLHIVVNRGYMTFEGLDSFPPYPLFVCMVRKSIHLCSDMTNLSRYHFFQPEDGDVTHCVYYFMCTVCIV